MIHLPTQKHQRTPLGYSMDTVTHIRKQLSPCFKPYESDDDRVTGGVRLDFNYWISNGAPLVDQHIQEIIMSILNDDRNSYISLRKNFKIKHLVVVTLHGIDPMMLQLHLSSLAFMNKLSCMPIRHTTSPGTVLNTIHCDECTRGTTTTQWNAMEIVPMNTLLLWTELSPIRIGYDRLLRDEEDDTYGQPVSVIDHRDCAAVLHRLFREGILLFKVRETERE